MQTLSGVRRNLGLVLVQQSSAWISSLWCGIRSLDGRIPLPENGAWVVLLSWWFLKEVAEWGGKSAKWTVRTPSFLSWLWHHLALWAWAGHLTSAKRGLKNLQSLYSASLADLFLKGINRLSVISSVVRNSILCFPVLCYFSMIKIFFFFLFEAQ